jgi:hypothetical protein
MADEVSAVTHELGDLLGVAQEILALRDGALAVAAPVEHEQANTVIGERSLGHPLLGARRERAVYEHDWRAGAPRVDEQVAGRH